MTRNALGRGLSSLLQGEDLELSSNQLAPGASPSLKISCDAIDTNPWQPRERIATEELEELAESIRTHGLLQPVLVRPKPDGRYHLIAGERRIRAARMGGLKEVPAIVLDVDDVQVLAMAMTENIQRADLNPVEEAAGYRVLRDRFGLTQEEISQRVGKPRSTIANYLRILQLPEEVRDAIVSAEISLGHARALAGLEREEDILVCLEKIIRRGLNVRETETICQRAKPSAGKPSASPDTDEPKAKVSDPDTEALQAKIRERLGARARLVMKSGQAGRLEIQFADFGQLNRILSLMGVELD
jgi:ParB family chromosome partitioning protein